MTPVYKAAAAVTISVPLPLDATSGVHAVTAITVAVRDETGVLIGNLTPGIPDDIDSELTFTVPAERNLLPVGARKGARQIEVTMTDATGTFIEINHYVLAATNQLTLLENTFMSYPESLMVRSDLPQLMGWDIATDTDRQAALLVAHQAMCNLRYRYRVGQAGSQRRLSDFPGVSTDTAGGIWATISDIRSVLDWEWQEMPADFKTALKRAQIVEADNSLAGDPVGEKRRMGIVSETIGESSMFFKQSPDIKLPISSAAMVHLRGFVSFSTRSARA